jgi:DNA-binding NarL/FixJ family response regulator
LLIFTFFVFLHQIALKMIRIIIVDDHKLIRITLGLAFESRFPDIIVAGVADSGESLFSMLPTTPADLILLDINLPGMGGIEAARRLRREYPHIKILAISADSSAEMIESILEVGIHGFISKQFGDANEIAEAIRAVVGGMEYFGKDVASLIYSVYVSKKKTTSVTPEFSPREREIIELCREGLISKEIAARLKISPNTVITHKERIFRKLGINNTMEMVQYALKKGIIKTN